jgi:ABC-type tungstate transport system permease subunit
MSEEPVPYTVTDKATILSYRARLDELEAILRHLDRHTLDLWLYATSLTAHPDRYEWSVVLDLIREVRDAYGLRTPDR